MFTQIFLCSVLFGCGGSGGSPTQPAPNVTPPQGEADTENRYLPIDRRSENTSVLEGSALIQRNASQNNSGFTLVPTSGTFNHNTGAFTLADGQYKITGIGRLNDQSVINDHNSYLLIDNSLGDHNFSRSYQQSYDWRGKTYDTLGIFGVSTQADDMPIKGSANYRGQATGLIVTRTDGYDLIHGTSNVEVDFSTSRGSIQLSDFDVRSHTTGLSTAPPIDIIRVTNVSIEGNDLTGGEVKTFLHGSEVNVVGEKSISSVGANFFGFDGDTLRPAEIGGVVFLEGDHGFLAGNFISD